MARYLGIVAALSAEADYVFFPECPPPVDWPDKLCKKLSQARLSDLFFTRICFNLTINIVLSMYFYVLHFY